MVTDENIENVQRMIDKVFMETDGIDYWKAGAVKMFVDSILAGLRGEEMTFDGYDQ